MAGSISLDYRYTAGVAGERFFRAISRSGKILAAKCGECGVVYLPPRMYCASCLRETGEWQEVSREGYLYSFTKIKEGRHFSVIGLVKFRGVQGGLLVRLKGEAERFKLDQRMLVSVRNGSVSAEPA